MARLLLWILAPLLGLLAGLGYFMFLKSPPPLPEMDLNRWWGPEELKSKQDISIRPFKVKFDEQMIHDLKHRLKNHRPWTPPLEGVGFEYGFNSNELEGWVSYWANSYNFKERENFFNKYPQFKTNIQGLDIHFIRVKPYQVPAGVEVVPLLLLHGWPGSVREFYEAIPLLTAISKERNFAVEVIVPSYPGYGFSDAAVRTGLSSPEMAVMFRNLMHRLGYSKYYIQGGNWGGLITSVMVTLFPEDILGLHSNLLQAMTTQSTILEIIGAFIPSLVVEPHLADRLYPLSKTYSTLIEEMGYMHIQATKPDTVGIALTDSPVGLLAYIAEKFSTWTNTDFRKHKDGNLAFRFTKEQILDNIMLYWSSRCITTSMRLYADTFNKHTSELRIDDLYKSTAGPEAFSMYRQSDTLEDLPILTQAGQAGFFVWHYRMDIPPSLCPRIPTYAPTWGLQAKNELFARQPLTILKTKYKNILHLTTLDDGGNFLAFELPQEFSADVLKAIDAFRKLNATKPKTEL